MGRFTSLAIANRKQLVSMQIPTSFESKMLIRHEPACNRVTDIVWGWDESEAPKTFKVMKGPLRGFQETIFCTM